MKKLVSLIVNGDLHELYVDTRRTLLDVLRNELSLMGAHRGCDAGDCGACTIHVNNLPMTSCLLLAVDWDGAEITTVEGVLKDGQMHPVQQALVEKGGIQCGFCTPGFVMNAVRHCWMKTPIPPRLKCVPGFRETCAGAPGM